jgi:glucose/arabinose dehydrogenase
MQLRRLGHRPQAMPGQSYELAGERFVVETVASCLKVPWAMAWTPDGRMLVTERPGRLLVIEPGTREARLLTEVAGVDARA